MMARRKGSVLTGIGVILMAAALGLSAYNIWDDERAARTASDAVERLVEAEGIVLKDMSFESILEELDNPVPPVASAEETPEPAIYQMNPEMEMPVEQLEKWEYIGILELPWRGVALPIIHQWSYPALKEAPCRYDGSAYTGDLIIAGHNYRAHFACLKRLTAGEPVRFTDMDGNVFEYTVVAQEVLYPSDVAGMKAGDWDLTLFTCTVGGEDRIAVRCRLEGTV